MLLSHNLRPSPLSHAYASHTSAGLDKTLPPPSCASQPAISCLALAHRVWICSACLIRHLHRDSRGTPTWNQRSKWPASSTRRENLVQRRLRQHSKGRKRRRHSHDVYPIYLDYDIKRLCHHGEAPASQNPHEARHAHTLDPLLGGTSKPSYCVFVS